MNVFPHFPSKEIQRINPCYASDARRHEDPTTPMLDSIRHWGSAQWCKFNRQSKDVSTPYFIKILRFEMETPSDKSWEILPRALRVLKEMGYSRKKTNWGDRGHNFLKKTLEFLGFLLHPWKFKTTRRFSPENSQNCMTPVATLLEKFWGKKPKPLEIPSDFSW